MIEQQLSLEIPPGLHMNGSMMERAGKWADGNYVRFHNGVARPMGGKATLSTTGGAIPNGGPPKGMFRFWSTSGGHTLVVGQHTKMYRIYNLDDLSNNVNQVDDITPSTGLADQGDVNGWSFANLGDDLIFTNSGWPTAVTHPELWVWQADAALAVLIDASSVYRGVFVTPENFMVLIEQLHTLKWASQGTYDELTPATGNSAGSIDVPSPYLLICGRAMVGESLVWTTGDLWAMTYVGGDLIYGLRKVGDNCGILGANNVAITNGVARWMGQGGFFEYDGYVRPLECPLSEWIFSDIARTHAHRFFTVNIPQYSAIQFWYMSGSGGDWCDRFVEYNYENNTWTKGEDIYRTAGVGEWPTDSTSGPTGSSPTAPVMTGTTYSAIYLHEQTGVLTSDADSSKPYLESGPLHLAADGNAVVKVQKIIPDKALTSDDISLQAGGFPQDTEVQYGPYAVTLANPPIDTRLTARYVRYKQTLESQSSSVGIPRIGIIPGGSKR